MLSRPEWIKIGALALQTVTDRIRSSRNVSDQTAKAYSPRSPVYLPSAIFGKSTLPKRRKSGNRYSKFQNYSAAKRNIGRSGQRDLTVTNKMLGSGTGIVNVLNDGVDIGFVRKEEELKMRGNERHDHMWGFSRRDAQRIGDVAEELLAQKFFNIALGKGGTSITLR